MKQTQATDENELRRLCSIIWPLIVLERKLKRTYDKIRYYEKHSQASSPDILEKFWQATKEKIKLLEKIHKFRETEKWRLKKLQEQLNVQQMVGNGRIIGLYLASEDRDLSVAEIESKHVEYITNKLIEKALQ